MNYSYVNVEKNCSQYDGESFAYGSVCEAKYVESLIPAYKGNKYIEALPQVPDTRGMYKRCMVSMPGWNSNTDDKSELQKLMEIQQLENIRIPLSYYKDLWNEIYMSMTASYSKRTQIVTNVHPTSIIVNGNEVKNAGDLVADAKAAPAGFNMLGTSGCGKSSALELALNYYPKVIRHTDGNGMSTIQIPYLFVTCPPDSNFKVLYQQIGKEVDRYLGNSEPWIEKEIMGSSRSSLGEIRARVAKVIERFAVGLLIVDEIQHLSFASQSERSFNALKVLANETMVSIGVVGTSDALRNIYTDEQTARRVGKSIPCDAYTNSRDFFDYIMAFILNYKWFDKDEVFTSECLDIIFRETHGIVAYIVLLYELICIDYVTQQSAGTELKITPDYILAIVDKYFGIVKNALEMNYTDNCRRDIAIQDSIRKAKGRIQYEIDTLKEKQNEAETIAMGSEISKDQIIKENVISVVASIYTDIPKERIEKCYDYVWDRSSKKVKQDSSLLTQSIIRKIIKDHAPRKISSRKQDLEIVNEEFERVLKVSIQDPNIGPKDKIS